MSFWGTFYVIGYVPFWPRKGRGCRCLDLRWTSCCSCFLCLSTTTWRILVIAMLSSILLLFVTAIAEVFGWVGDLLLCWVYHRRVVWVHRIILASTWFSACFPRSCLRTSSSFIESSRFVHWPCLGFSSLVVFSTLLIWICNSIPVIVFCL